METPFVFHQASQCARTRSDATGLNLYVAAAFGTARAMQFVPVFPDADLEVIWYERRQ
jgi:hypothetical protein